MATDGDDPETWDMAVGFKLRQHVSGTPWILVEHLSGPPLPILDEGFLGLDLVQGTTSRQAIELRDMLNEHVAHLTYTGPMHGAWVDNPGRRARAKRRQSRSPD